VKECGGSAAERVGAVRSNSAASNCIHGGRSVSPDRARLSLFERLRQLLQRLRRIVGEMVVDEREH
jgi:hypothetical protein